MLDTIISELNGATRQWAVVLTTLFVSTTWILRREWKTLWLPPLLAGLIGITSYMVREPCRPDYYRFCGQNPWLVAGGTLAAGLVIAGVWLVSSRITYGWVLIAGAMYHLDYMLMMVHPPLWVRVPFIGGALVCILLWATSRVRFAWYRLKSRDQHLVFT